MASEGTTAKGAITRKPRSLLWDSVNRLQKNYLAVGSLVFLALLVIVALAAPFISSGDYANQSLKHNYVVRSWMLGFMPETASPPTIVTEDGSRIKPEGDIVGYANVVTGSDYPLGGDDLGRDLWTRTVYGARISLIIALVASTVSLVVGTIYGLFSGYLGGMTDNIMMRFVDFLYGFPFLIVVILSQVYFKALSNRTSGEGFGQMIIDLNNAMGGVLFMFIAIGLVNWLGLARITRGQVLALRETEYVHAAKAVGAKTGRIVFRHILPNIIGTLIIVETLAIPGYIFTEAFLSFIGLGVNAPTPSWGIMIADAAATIRSYPHILLPPSIALTLTTLAFNFVGDGLRDAFDPRLRD